MVMTFVHRDILPLDLGLELSSLMYKLVLFSARSQIQRSKTLRQRLSCKKFIGECPWDQHLWGSKESRTWQKEKLNLKAGAAETSADLTGRRELRWPFRDVLPLQQGHPASLPPLCGHWMQTPGKERALSERAFSWWWQLLENTTSHNMSNSATNPTPG